MARSLTTRPFSSARLVLPTLWLSLLVMLLNCVRGPQWEAAIVVEAAGLRPPQERDDGRR